jgi:hypothetical protein
MSILITPRQIQRTIRLALWLILIGIAVIVIPDWLAIDFGVITGGMLICMGTAGASLRTWARERGLWMLSAAFLVLFLPTCSLMLFHELSDIFTGRYGALPLALDATLGSAALGFLVRFLASVIILNYRLSGDAGTPPT